VNDGKADLARAARELAVRIPTTLAPLARVAFNFWWSWQPSCVDAFREIDAQRFELTGHNPVRMLKEATVSSLARAARDPAFVARIESLERDLDRMLEAGENAGGIPADRSVAFFCMEYGIQASLPIYSGGLGVLAGDILKEASDLRVPMVGVGLLYWQGNYHQRLDPSGWQHDYWVETEPEFLPTALVTAEDGSPLTVTVPIGDRSVHAQIWRVDVGRIPLFLLDTRRPENDVVDRWISARLYVGDPRIRLAQYAMLGIGGLRALRAMGIEPSILHLNEGHPALAPIELAAEATERGAPFEDAVAGARSRTVFTTHTPVPAGNDLASRLGSEDRFLRLGRISPHAVDEDFGMTTLALRLSHVANGVSRRHGEVARGMWGSLFPDRAENDVPIGQVTNGVHVPTWMAPPMRALLDRHLGRGWLHHAGDPATWDPVTAIPDEELWAVRNELRRVLVDHARDRSALDRLARGESSESVEAAREAFDPAALTVGFARRVATYKRLGLLIADRDRVTRFLQAKPHVQVFIAGKAHPQDDEAKRSLQRLFETSWAGRAGLQVTFLEDYDLTLAALLVVGCDVWLNLPRPPLEASGTSGMKAALNGGLNLSVLDGWWAEAYDGANGWAIPGDVEDDVEEQDRRDAEAFYSTIENEVVPLFYERDASGVPRGWVGRIKASLRTIGPRFSATRMLGDYLARSYSMLSESRPG
jgi:starch phosphorylase